MRVVLLLLALLVFAPAAHAQAPNPVVEQAIDALERDPTYVHPDARPTLTNAQVDALENRIAAQGAGPMFVAILPPDAGDPDAAIRSIAQRLGRSAFYAVVVGRTFRGGQIGGLLPEGRTPAIALEAAATGGDLEGVLTGFVDRVGAARNAGREEDAGGGGGGVGAGGVVLLALVALFGGTFLLSRRRRAQQERTDFDEAKDNARDDLVALGEDIRALDIDVELDSTPAAVKDHYARAVERYQQAEEQWERARTPADLEPVGQALEEGRYEMLAAEAAMAGRTVPERRPPCFFDPRHGPSSRDVEWAPPGGVPRLVPTCEADAQRVERGEDPASREVLVHGQRMPYWQAGPAYAPFAGGFFSPFGGGLLPGLLVGTALGTTLGGLAAGPAYGGDWGGGDIGGGDFGGDVGGGDFGGGGGDFGGGDF